MLPFSKAAGRGDERQHSNHCKLQCGPGPYAGKHSGADVLAVKMEYREVRISGLLAGGLFSLKMSDGDRPDESGQTKDKSFDILVRKI